MKMLEGASEERWPIHPNLINGWLGEEKAVDFTPGLSDYQCEETYGGKGRKPSNVETALFLGLAHRTEDPLGTIRELVDTTKADRLLVHFLVLRDRRRMDPKWRDEDKLRLVSNRAAVAFVQNEMWGEVIACRTVDHKREPSDWYLLIRGKESEEEVPFYETPPPDPVHPIETVVETKEEVDANTDVRDDVWELQEEE